MVFTAIVPSNLRITHIKDEKGRLRGVICDETGTQDGATSVWYYPSTTGAVRSLVEPFMGKLMRLKHLSFESTDVVANAGRFDTYTANTSTYGPMFGWLWTGVITSIVEIKPDVLMKFDNHLMGMSGVLGWNPYAAFTNTTTVTVRAYWEVEDD